MKAGKPVHTEAKSSLADGLAVPKVGDNAFATARHRVDHVCVVEEKWIGLAILRLAEIEKCVVEGAGPLDWQLVCQGSWTPYSRGKRKNRAQIPDKYFT